MQTYEIIETPTSLSSGFCVNYYLDGEYVGSMFSYEFGSPAPLLEYSALRSPEWSVAIAIAHDELIDCGLLV